jgi:hypothetical protein
MWITGTFGEGKKTKLRGCTIKNNNQPEEKTTIFSKNKDFAFRVPYFNAKKVYGTRKCDDTHTDRHTHTHTEVVLVLC